MHTGGYVSIDTLLGFAGFIVNAAVLLIGAGIAWGKLNQMSTSFTAAMASMSDRIKTLEDDSKDRAKDLARFAAIETTLSGMKEDIHRIVQVVEARRYPQDIQTFDPPSTRPQPIWAGDIPPDVLAGLSVIAKLAGKTH